LNTKLFMVVSSVALALAGGAATFAPAETLAAFGVPTVEAVPVLVEAVRRGGDRQSTAIDALSSIGPAASAAIPALAELLLEGEAYKAPDALAAIGPMAVPALVSVLALRESEDHNLSYAAYSAGKAIQELGEAAIAPIVDLLTADPANVAAVSALGWVGPAAVPTLTPLFESREAEVRAAAAEALAKIGPEASSAIAPLARALWDDDGEVRQCAAKAHCRIGPEARPALVAGRDEPLAPDTLAIVVRGLANLGPESDARNRQQYRER
jgi:HEAT repeat protein